MRLKTLRLKPSAGVCWETWACTMRLIQKQRRELGRKPMQQYQDFHDTPVSFTFTFEMINSTVYRQLILFWPFGDIERESIKSINVICHCCIRQTVINLAWHLVVCLAIVLNYSILCKPCFSLWEFTAVLNGHWRLSCLSVSGGK